MNANPLETLRDVETYLAEREDVVDGDYGQPAPNAEMTLLREVRAAIRALSAEAVAYRWWRNGEPRGFWINGQPTQQQFAAAEQCKDRAEWTIEYAYAATPPSPAESAEGNGLSRPSEAVLVLLNHLETLMDEGKLAEDAIPVAMWNAVSCPAAPSQEVPTEQPVSQVSDAMVERAWMAFTGRDKLGKAYASDASCMMPNERQDIRRALEAVSQPQPGRVEGMAKALRDILEAGLNGPGHVRLFNAGRDALIAYEAAAPTAGDQQATP